jgi:transposase
MVMDAVSCLRAARASGRVAGMARTGRPKAELTLTDQERATLERWARRAKSGQALALRARIVLACADGRDNKAVAAALGCHPATAGKWRSRFIARRLDGLCDEDRPGRPVSITDEQVEAVVVATLEETPKDATHWSRASMAKKSGLSRSTVGRIWMAFKLKPHLADGFKVSTDPLFIEKVHDVVGLYLNPPEHAVVLCADEKSQIQALDRSSPVLPMMPGMPEKRTHDYVRYGTTTLFAALNIATGLVISELHRQHRAAEWKKFLQAIDQAVPADLEVHIVADNYATHKTPAIQAWLASHPRFTMHFTPTSSSWLNQVERWFGELTAKMIRRGAHRSVKALETDIRAWISNWNENPRPFVWTKTADEILESLGRLLLRTSGAGH